MEQVSSEQADQIREALRRVLASAEFARAPRSSRFLAFIVDETLSGRSEELKEYTIGLGVFQKAETFDPRTDSTVRTEATKLRARLDRYYERDAQERPGVRIRLPKGTYVPEFEQTAALVPAANSLHSGPEVVQETPSEKLPPIAAKQIASFPKPFAWKLVLGGLGASAALVLLALGVTRLNTNPDLPPRVKAISTLAHLGDGVLRTPSWSPDGREVAFCWRRQSDQFDIYVVPVAGQAHPRRLTTNAASDWAPAWSPDGQVIAFVRDPLENGQVILIPSAGGPERVLTGVTSGRVGWTADGRSLLLQAPERPGRPDVIYAANLRTLERKQLTFLQSESIGHSNFASSADGKMLAFIDARPSKLLVTVTPLDRWLPEVLATIDRDFGGLAWSRDGLGLFIAGRQLRFVSLQKRRPELVQGIAVAAGHISCAREGSKLLFVNTSPQSEIYGVSAAREPYPLFALPGSESNPRFSKVGASIAFMSDRTGSRQIWLMDLKTKETRQLTAVTSCSPRSLDWSADDRSIVFDCEAGLRSSLHTIAVTGGIAAEPKQIEAAGDAAERPAYSYDGRHIYFVNQAGPEPSVMRIVSDGRQAPEVVRTAPTYEIRESSDGWLYFTTDVKTIGLWRAKGSGTPELVNADVEPSAWDVTSAGVYWAVPNAKAEITFHLPAANGRTSTRAYTTVQVSQGTAQLQMTVSPTGEIAFRRSTPSDTLMVAELER